jgi:hypothetical protein
MTPTGEAVVTAIRDRKIGAYHSLGALAGDHYPYGFNDVEALVGGRKFDVYSTFLEFDSDFTGNPTPPGTRKKHSDVEAAAAAGHDILVALAPVTAYVLGSDSNYHPQYVTMADLQTGAYDAQITALADWLLGLGVTVTIRFCWEANLSSSVWYPGTTSAATWSAGVVVTTTGLPVVTSAADYIAGWRYLTNLLRGRGCSTAPARRTPPPASPPATP